MNGQIKPQSSMALILCDHKNSQRRLDRCLKLFAMLLSQIDELADLIASTIFIGFRSLSLMGASVLELAIGNARISRVWRVARARSACVN